MDIPRDEHADIDRKVKGLLNKLTMRNFRSIAEQITTLVSAPRNEKGEGILQSVVQLIFEQAVIDAPSAERYARLCQWMLEHIEPRLQDGESTGGGDESTTGGELLKGCVLKQCDEYIKHERGTEDSSDGTLEHSECTKNEAEVVEQTLDTKTARGRRFAFIKFIGQLFKLQIIPPRIVHNCIEALIPDSNNPEEEEIESLCSLITTVGSSLDTPEARPDVDAYFARMEGITKDSNVRPRFRFRVQDVLELRERNWVARNAVVVPTAKVGSFTNVPARAVASGEGHREPQTSLVTRGTAPAPRPQMNARKPKMTQLATLGSLTEE